MVNAALGLAAALAVFSTAFMLYQIFLQNGRLLARLDSLERSLEWRQIPGEGPRARVQRLFRHFTVGNVFEAKNIVSSVAFGDEYGIRDLKFALEDVMIDVGAHIGVFTYLCYIQGSRAIHAYEPCERNFQLLEKNLGALPGVHLSRRAVWRSDAEGQGELLLSGRDADNTGSHTVLSAGRVFDFPEQKFLDTTAGQAVPTVALDEILKEFHRVKLLKLDCEGSEFPILLTSRQLHKVERIVAEVHEIDEVAIRMLDPRSQVEGYTAYRLQNLIDRLESEGFQVVTRKGAAHMYILEARR